MSTFSTANVYFKITKIFYEFKGKKKTNKTTPINTRASKKKKKNQTFGGKPEGLVLFGGLCSLMILIPQGKPIKVQLNTQHNKGKPNYRSTDVKKYKNLP